MALQCMRIHRALNRADLMMGCERTPFLVLAVLTAMFLVVMMTWATTVAGILLWFSGLWALRAMAKADPWLTTVYQRHIRYQAYYPARSTPFAASWSKGQ